MFDALLRTRRTRQLARAINRQDVDQIEVLLAKGVNLDDFKAKLPDPIPHAMHDHYRVVSDVLEWAAECNLPLSGFEALVAAGAKESTLAYHKALHQEQIPDSTWKDAAQVAALIQPASFEARRQGDELHKHTLRVAASQPGPRL